MLYAQRPVTMEFDLYQNAANNIIATEGSFPISYSGTLNGNNYEFELEQPSVEFTQNVMKMIAVLKINTTPTGYLELEIRPSIKVDYSLSVDNILAFLKDFPNYINSSFPQLPQWVRNLIIEKYQALQLEIYPAKVLDYAESFTPGYLAIEVSNIIFAVNALPGKLRISISFEVTGIPPHYQCYTFNKTKVKIKSNVAVNVKKLTVFVINGIKYYEFEGNIPIAKGGEAIFDYYHQNNNTNTQSGRFIRVLLESDIRGTFLRLYDASYMPTDDQWNGPKSMQVSFD